VPDFPHPLPPAGPPDEPGQDWLPDPDENGPDWDDYPPPDDLIEEYFPPGGPAGSGAGPLSGPPPAPRAAFTHGGPADVLRPGPQLAALADEVHAAGAEHLDDDQLTGLLQAASRLAAWAASLKLSAISELAARRAAEARASGDWRLVEHVSDEVAVALTLTRFGADWMLSLAVGLDRLPLTRAALATGAIDERRAAVIVDELTGLSDEDAAAVEARLIDKAPGQTTAQLRQAARRAVIAADPAAAKRRKEKALQDARVEAFTEAAGTAALAGRDLPPADVLAADQNLTALALDMRQAGAEGTLDQLRAHAYLHLLSGQPPEALTGPPPDEVQSGGPGAGQRTRPAGTPRPPVLRGSVHLTMPLGTWLGWSESAGEAAGYGPLDADDSRALAARLAANPASRWCITVTDPAGHPIAHGCARTGPRAGPGPPDPLGWVRRVKITPLETGTCTHRREARGYQPGPTLRHLIRIRNPRCTAPGCRHPAHRCDQDHTIPYHDGGRTCECNLGPLCRRHHKCKQLPRWTLSQTSPGRFTWTTPGGRSYRTAPARYPA
jgi:hypothetical protein